MISEYEDKCAVAHVPTRFFFSAHYACEGFCSSAGDSHLAGHQSEDTREPAQRVRLLKFCTTAETGYIAPDGNCQLLCSAMTTLTGALDMDQTPSAPRGDLTIRTLAMPADANPSGDIFGGWVLSQMDIAGGIAAGQRAQGRVATVAIDAMNFIRPVYIGDVLCVYASVEKTGRTSVTIHLEAWALRKRVGERVKVTDGRFVFVAIDNDGQPRPVTNEAGA